MNWGAPFIIAFICLLMASATELSTGATDVANSIAVYGFYSLVVGIALQVASYAKYGETGTASQAEAPEAVVVHAPTRLPRRTKVAAIATVGLIILAAVVVGYPTLMHPGPVSVGTASSVSSSGSSSSASSSGCGGARSDGTVFISTNATVSIGICGQSFLVPAGTGGGLTYSYHAGLVNFTAPSSVNGSAFEFWYVIVGNNAPSRVDSVTLSLNLPTGLASQSSIIELFYTAPPPPPKIVGYWPLDEGSGSLAFDASGNGNNGTLVNYPTWLSGANCKFGGCLNFASASNQYVSTNYNPGAVSSISLSLWANFASVGAAQNLFTSSAASLNGNTYGFALQLYPGGIGIFSESATGADCYASFTWTPSISVWYHLAATFNAGTYGLYINGVSQTATGGTGSCSTTYNGGSATYIGAGNGYYVNGLLDDVRIYSSALSPAQISQLYALTPSSTTSTFSTSSTSSASSASTSMSVTTSSTSSKSPLLRRAQ